MRITWTIKKELDIAQYKIKNWTVIKCSTTVETGYKNIVGCRKTCSYNRYVLIKGKINRDTYRNVSSEDVLINGMFLYPVFL